MGTFQDFLAVLGQRESSGDYGIVSPAGYLGMYQMSEILLVDIGWLGSDGKYDNNYTNGGMWTSKAQGYGVTNKDTFLSNSAAQDAAVTEALDKNWNTYLKSYRQYAGQTLNGYDLTMSGLVAAAHLVGWSKVKTFLESGGTADATDGNGVKLTTYLKEFANYDLPSNFSDNLGSGNLLKGGSGKDKFDGKAGSDTIKGNGGADTIYGGADGDKLYGEVADKEALSGSAGGDEIYGGQGDDTIFATQSDGDDKYYGGDDTKAGGTSDGTDVLDMTKVTGNVAIEWDASSKGFKITSNAGTDTIVSIDEIKLASGTNVTLIMSVTSALTEATTLKITGDNLTFSLSS